MATFFVCTVMVSIGICVLLMSSAVQRGDSAPLVGSIAPAVKADCLDGKTVFDMAVNHGKRPTVLIFGSCT